MKKVKLDLSFSHRYDVELSKELPSSSGELEHFYFSGDMGTEGKDGLLVRVVPHTGAAWLGTFAFGLDYQEAVMGVFSCPDEFTLCVVSSGRGYIVRATDPQTWTQVQAYPITAVYPMIERKRLVLVDLTGMTAYGSEGVAWKTPDLTWDGLRVTSVTPEYLRGLAWDSPNQRDVEFSVEVLTGRHEGGSSAVMYLDR